MPPDRCERGGRQTVRSLGGSRTPGRPVARVLETSSPHWGCDIARGVRTQRGAPSALRYTYGIVTSINTNPGASSSYPSEQAGGAPVATKEKAPPSPAGLSEVDGAAARVRDRHA